MTVNRFGHVDVRVTDMANALAFYRRLLPAIGFPVFEAGRRWQVFYAEGPRPSAPWYALIGEVDHVPNDNRIAFWAESRAEVDALAAIARDAGARRVSGPKEMPEYSAGYYAVFFEDPCGNRLEIAHTA